jgi:predicted ATP-dependent endonuclease of OLD family
MIEEPEIYMHPQMERKIADTLYEIAKDGSAQIICTTHSPIFINIADKHKSLVRLTRNQPDNLTLTQVDEIFTDPDKEGKKKRLRMMLNFDPTVNEAFFAKRVVLVEGDTEIIVFKEGAELLGIFKPENQKHLKREVTFVNCRGKWTIAAFQEVLNRFRIEYVVVHDKDEDDVEKGANARILSLLAGNETRRKMFDRKIEDQLEISETKKDKPFKALEKIKELSNSGKLNSKIGAFIKFAYGIKK